MNREITIERVTLADAEELLAIYAPYVEETAISFEYEVPTVAEFQKRIQDISSILPYIKAVKNGKIIGYAYASKFKGRKAYDWSVETTIYLKKEERGKGTGKILYSALENSLREMGILNMNACIAVTDREDIHLTNASPKFHESLGFQKIATFHQSGYKFHTWYDMIWMEKMLGDHQDIQPEVRFGDWKIC